MRSRQSTWTHLGACLALAVMVVSSSVPAAAELRIDGQAAARLKAGDAIIDVVPDDSGEADGKIEAMIDIAARPEAVFAVMTDCERTLKFVAELTLCKVLESSRDGRMDVREHHSRWLSILPEMVSVFRSVYVPGREIRFSRISGDLRFMEGVWHLDPLNGGAATRVHYEARVGINMPIPGFMIRNALESDVPKLLKALRAEVVSGNSAAR